MNWQSNNQRLCKIHKTFKFGKLNWYKEAMGHNIDKSFKSSYIADKTKAVTFNDSSSK